MQDEPSRSRPKAERWFYGAMVLVGIYATLRYGSEWAYYLGRLVGEN